MIENTRKTLDDCHLIYLIAYFATIMVLCLKYERTGTYKFHFTEIGASFDPFFHTQNAFSSLVFSIVGFLFIFHNIFSGNYFLIMGFINLLLGMSSFLFHATESKFWHSIDISLVIINKLGIFLLQAGVDLEQASRIIVFFCVVLLAFLFLSIMSNQQYIVNKYRNYFLYPLTIGLLITMNKEIIHLYLLFFVAYIFKFADITWVGRGIRYKGGIHGTAIYHILTGICIYHHGSWYMNK